MVFDTTKTGLTPITSNIIKPYKRTQMPKLEFQMCIQPAPIAAKPFATLSNPFRKGCSIFCNHPTSDTELKLAIKKSKQKKDDDGNEFGVDEKALAERVGEVLEEMLSRYKQGSDPGSSPGEQSPPPTRTVLVLDLRRTASQETLSTTMGGRATSGGFQSSNMSPSQSSLSGPIRSTISKAPQTPPMNETQSLLDNEGELNADGGVEEDADIQKRRGKLKKKKKKNVTNNIDEKSGKEVIGLIEPGETQISACKDGTDDLSWHGSSNATPQPTLDPLDAGISQSHLVSDLFDNRTLRHLRRSLTVQQAEGEFRRIWRKVLKEALGASDVLPEDELRPEIKAEVQISPCQPDNWLTYPRTFKYSSARFDLPIDKRQLNEMTSLEYLRNFIAVDKDRRLLYNHVFEKYIASREGENGRYLIGKQLVTALGTVMGRDFIDDEIAKLNSMVEWDAEQKIDFRTWIGLCCLCERVFGLQFSSGDNPDLGRTPTLEQVDFELLNNELPNLKPDEKLSELLKAVQIS